MKLHLPPTGDIFVALLASCSKVVAPLGADGWG